MNPHTHRPADEPALDDEALGDVIERAARLQLEDAHGGASMSSLTEVKDVARELAIDPSFIDAALVERERALVERERADEVARVARERRRAFALEVAATAAKHALALGAAIALLLLATSAVRSLVSSVRGRAAPASAQAEAPPPKVVVAPPQLPAPEAPILASAQELAAERDDLLARIQRLKGASVAAGCDAQWGRGETCYVSNRLMTRAQIDRELARMRARVTEIERTLPRAD